MTTWQQVMREQVDSNALFLKASGLTPEDIVDALVDKAREVGRAAEADAVQEHRVESLKHVAALLARPMTDDQQLVIRALEMRLLETLLDAYPLWVVVRLDYEDRVPRITLLTTERWRAEAAGLEGCYRYDVLRVDSSFAEWFESLLTHSGGDKRELESIARGTYFELLKRAAERVRA